MLRDAKYNPKNNPNHNPKTKTTPSPNLRTGSLWKTAENAEFSGKTCGKLC